MPLLLSTHNNLRGWVGSGHGLENRHQNKGDTKSVLGALRSTVRVGGAAALFGSSKLDKAQHQRHAALHKHHDASGEPSAPGATASETATAAASASATDADWEAVRLMTAAKILSSSASTELDDSSASLDDTSSLPDSLTASAQLDESGLGALSVLDEIHTINADSLALAVGILRQQQPLDANEDDVQLSERLRDFLQVLRRRPVSTTFAGDGVAATAGLGHASSTQAAAAGQGRTSSTGPAADPGMLTASGAAGAAGTGADSDTDSFWAAGDEWADVRSALMNIGVNASLDEEDEEDVWDLEAGRVKTRRTRLLRSLPKLDSSTAQQLTAFLAELQQHQGHTVGAPTTHQPGVNSSTVLDPGAHAAPTKGQQGQGVREEEEQWWQQAALAYGLLRQQAEKVHQAQDQQASEEQ